MIYSLSGFWKIKAGIEQLDLGQQSIFSLNSLSNHIARRLMETNDTSILGEFLIQNSVFGFILLLGAAYLELFSLIVFFRPKLHRYWGAALMLMHLGIGLGMSINFTHSTLVLGLLLVASPLQRKERSLIKILTDLPLFGGIFWLIQTIFSRKKYENIILFYDGSCGFCNSFVQFILKNKIEKTMRFAPLRGETYEKVFGKKNVLSNFDSLVFFNPDNQTSYIHSKSALMSLWMCKNSIKYLILFAIIPSEISDQFYKLFAIIRKKLPARECKLLSQDERVFFID